MVTIDTHRDTQTDRYIDRHRDTLTDRQIHRHRDTLADRYTDRHRDTLTDIHRQTENRQRQRTVNGQSTMGRF